MTSTSGVCERKWTLEGDLQLADDKISDPSKSGYFLGHVAAGSASCRPDPLSILYAPPALWDIL